MLLLNTLSSLFRSDFKDYKVVEKKLFNPCGEHINSEFHIEFARYFFGFKFYKDFYTEECGWDYHICITICRNSKEEIIHEYKEFVKTVRGKTLVITHPSKGICNE